MQLGSTITAPASFVIHLVQCLNLIIICLFFLQIGINIICFAIFDCCNRLILALFRSASLNLIPIRIVYFFPLNPQRRAVCRLLEQPEITKVVAKSGKLNINWNRIAGAETYELLRSEASDGTYKKIATLTGDVITYTDKDVTLQKDYFYKLRARGGNKKGYSAYSEIKSGWVSRTYGRICRLLPVRKHGAHLIVIGNPWLCLGIVISLFCEFFLFLKAPSLCQAAVYLIRDSAIDWFPGKPQTSAVARLHRLDLRFPSRRFFGGLSWRDKEEQACWVSSCIDRTCFFEQFLGCQYIFEL